MVGGEDRWAARVEGEVCGSRCGSAHDGVRSEVYCLIVLLFGKSLFYCSIVYTSIVG